MLIALNVMNPSTSSRGTLRFSGNKIHCSAVVKCLLLNEQVFFSTKKGKGGENYQPQYIFRCRVGRKERRLSKVRKLCKSYTFTFFFSFAMRIAKLKKRGI